MLYFGAVRILIKNIKQLLQADNNPPQFRKGEDMNHLPSIDNAYVLIENGLISDFGKNEDAPTNADEIIDATGKLVMPAFCDSHTHIVFAASREDEFVDRIKGLTYEEIAAKGGGILNSAKKLNETSEDELYYSALQRLNEVNNKGTGAIEIKSGYGLTVDGELKMLRVIKRLKESSPLTIKATFLGAHAIPTEYKTNPKGYIDLIINEMLPAINREGLADFVDVFCEKNYFSPEQTAQILEAAAKYNLRPKVHVNQFNAIGGIKTAIEHNALSVDHLEVLPNEDLELLKQSTVIPVALPSCSFFLGIPYTPARKIIDNGLALALASDFNPGSTPSGSLPFVLSLACIKMNMLPNEAINALTLNAAFAMDCSKTLGSITVGKKANLIITKEVPSINYLPYAFGSNWVERVLVGGAT